MVLSLAAPVSAASPPAPKPKADSGLVNDNLAGPQAKKQQALKVKARDLVAKGKAKATGKNKVVKVAKGQFVELAFEGEDQILTLLGEFGTAPNNTHPGHPAHNGTPGPIAQRDPAARPDRRQHDDLDRRLQPEPLRQPALQQGAEPVDGELVSRAVVRAHTASTATSATGSRSRSTRRPTAATTAARIVCTRDIGRFLDDQTDRPGGTHSSRPARPPAQIDEMLAPFDVWDRYDYDEDGDFDEPDGYIDHFQSVHAGEGEETGGGAQGTDAIWSHRSYANAGFPAPPGPGRRRRPGHVPFGGLRIGGIPRDGSKYWIGDYTIEPENGGVGVFAHEFGHDLGLPDEYDTSGNTGGAENSTAWWTPWSQGSYGTVTDDLGSAPVDATIWEKWSLGWVESRRRPRGQEEHPQDQRRRRSAPRHAQGVQVILPDKVVNEDLGDPHTRVVLLRLRPRQRPRQHDDQVGHPRGRTDQRVVLGQLPHRAVLGLRLPPGVDRRRHDVHQHRHVGLDRRQQPTARTSATASPASPARRSPATTT